MADLLHNNFYKYNIDKLIYSGRDYMQQQNYYINLKVALQVVYPVANNYLPFILLYSLHILIYQKHKE